jgi:hypothetical protein
MNVRNVRNITVAVSDDLYRQTRRLAAQYDTTVTAMVVYLLQRLPAVLASAAARRLRDSAPPVPAATQPAQPSNQVPPQIPIPACTPVNDL